MSNFLFGSVMVLGLWAVIQFAYSSGYRRAINDQVWKDRWRKAS